MRTSVSPKDVVELLTELVKLDPGCIRSLFQRRYNCSREIADHPRVVVQADLLDKPKLGPLGLINGLFCESADDRGPVVMELKSDGRISGFRLYNPATDNVPHGRGRPLLVGERK
jgi:hypothetical protein